MARKQRHDDVALRKAFGEAVRLLRASIPLSQEALGRRAGLHRTYVGDIERGARNPSLVNIVRLANAANTTPEHLLKATSHYMNIGQS